MDHDQATEVRPTGPRFGGELAESGLHLGFVGLVFELVDTGAIAAVVACNSREQHYRTTIRTMRPIERLGDRERIMRQPNPVIARSRNLHRPIVQGAAPVAFARAYRAR